MSYVFPSSIAQYGPLDISEEQNWLEKQVEVRKVRRNSILQQQSGGQIIDGLSTWPMSSGQWVPRSHQWLSPWVERTFMGRRWAILRVSKKDCPGGHSWTWRMSPSKVKAVLRAFLSQWIKITQYSAIILYILCVVYYWPGFLQNTITDF